MRRVFQTVLLLVCLGLALGAPRGLVLAAIVAGIGIARSSAEW